MFVLKESRIRKNDFQTDNLFLEIPSGFKKILQSLTFTFDLSDKYDSQALEKEKAKALLNRLLSSTLKFTLNHDFLQKVKSF